MQITLMRAYQPGQTGGEAGGFCEFCGREWTGSSVVYGWAWTDGGPGVMCERCILHFADWQERENLGTRWPTREEYFEACRRYTTPYFATGKDYDRAIAEGHGDEHYHECYLTW